MSLFDLATGFLQKNAYSLPSDLPKMKKHWQVKLPCLAFNQRGKIAGSAVLQKNLIKLHPTLLKQNTQYFLDQVLAHEFAHLIVYQCWDKKPRFFSQYTIKPHGNEWKWCMESIFHRTSEVTHSLDVTNVGMKSVSYQCECQSVELSLIRHNKVINGKQQYFCRTCKTALTEVLT